MPDYVVDTHAVLWHFLNSPKLGQNARQVMDGAAHGQGTLIVPAIVMAELHYLNVKQVPPLDLRAAYQQMLACGYFRFVSFRAADALELDRLTALPNMHDRIIVEVARRIQVPVLTKDREIVMSGLVTTVW